MVSWPAVVACFAVFIVLGLVGVGGVVIRVCQRGVFALDVSGFVFEGKGYVDVEVYVRPGARFSSLRLEDGGLVFYTREKPRGGRANRSLIEFLSEVLGISSSRVRIVSGAGSRVKRVRIYGVTEEELKRALASVLGRGSG